MGEETKVREKKTAHAHGGDGDGEEEGEKKGAEMAPHVQRVFGASPGAVGKLLFSAPSVSLARPPVPGSPLRTPRAPRFFILSFSSSLLFDYRTIRTLARPTPPFIFLLFLDLSSSPSVSAGDLLVRPGYPDIPKKRKERKQKEIERKISGAPAS